VTDPNPRAVVGANSPPLDGADFLRTHLGEEFAHLEDEAMALDMARLQLPDELKTDADAEQLVAWVAKAKKFAGGSGAAEKARKDKGAPYLDAQRTINDFFAALTKDLNDAVKKLEAKHTAYGRAKAERERAERIRQQQEAARLAEEARREEQRKREEAEAAAQREAEAAARMRQATSDEERGAAFEEMQAAAQTSDTLREEADQAGAAAAKSERQADRHERAAEGDMTKLSRTATDGASASVSKKWKPEVVNWNALRASLGPLGPHLDSGVIESTLARIVRTQSAGGAVPTFTCPGVEIVEEHKSNIRAARG
jgi:hypothetical protein